MASAETVRRTKVVKCAVCGDLFIASRPNQKTCGVGCRSIYFKYKPKGEHSGVCEVCGKPFTTRQQRRFCDDNCRAKYHDKKVWTDATCPVCGKVFKRSTAKRIYCSRECTVAAKSARDKLRRASNE